MKSKPIESYGLIGDGETGALVGRDGSIDWLCWPRFDSASTFAALLGTAEHGRWRIGPADGSEASSRRYVGDTLVLETRFASAGGEVLLTDFMPMRGGHSHVVRIVKGVRGSMRLDMELVIRFGYGHDQPWMRRLDGNGRQVLQAIAGPDMVVLRTPVETHGENMKTVAQFEIAVGETLSFVLSYGTSYGELPPDIDADACLADTMDFWQEWSGSSKLQSDIINPETRAAVMRSLITLKAMAYAPTGGIVAAITTSLPEQLGGKRNWDYRYCWIRDATISLLALMDAGYYDEALAWRDWMLRAAAGSPTQLQIMYGIGGERRLSEWEVSWLPGYAESRPVRVGNAAHEQLQLDVFGELMDALHQGRRAGLPENDAAWAMQRALLQHLEQIWQQQDAGLWEVRGDLRHFTYSKVMAWVAVDRCIQSVEKFGMDGPADKWRELADRIHADVCEKGFDAELNSFVQAYGDKALDASLLLLPQLGFIGADDPRYRGTVAAIEKQLLVDGFVRRYDPGETDDGLGGSSEGVFLACSFWLADAYCMTGRFEDAEHLFGQLLKLRNDLGLLAEEYDVRQGRQVGNFPQAFSHVALLNTAKLLAKREGRQKRAATDRKADERAPAEAETA